jgi:hypothetical protein
MQRQEPESDFPKARSALDKINATGSGIRSYVLLHLVIAANSVS